MFPFCQAFQASLFFSFVLYFVSWFHRESRRGRERALEGERASERAQECISAHEKELMCSVASHLTNLSNFALEDISVLLCLQSRGRYRGGRRPSSDDIFHSPTVIPSSALRQTEYHDALPSSADVQSHITSSFADDGNAS